MAQGDDALAETAAELVALPLARFTAERTARAKAVRGDGDRDLAARITALAKPSASAWLVDLLARELPDDLQRVLDLGDDLREAQEAGDRERLRRLSGDRRTLLAEVVGRAAERAEAAGQRIGAAAVEEAQQTLQAAMTTPEAAAAVRSARLVRALDADGFDPVDLDDAVAGGAPPASAPPRRRRRVAPAEDDEAARREAEAEAARVREQRLGEAREAARAASATARTAAAEALDREQDVADLRRRMEDLQRRLDDARTAHGEAQRTAEQARRVADDAADEVDRLEAGA